MAATTTYDEADIRAGLARLDAITLHSAEHLDDSLRGMAKIGPLNDAERRLGAIADHMRELVLGGAA